MSYQALLFSTDEKASRVVSQILSELEFQVEACSEPFFAVKQITNQHYDALVVDYDNEQNATLLFKSARNSSSNSDSLAVALVQGQGGIAKAFRIGANLVLTKPIHPEQSKGTLRTAKGLLRKAEAAKSASAAAIASHKSAGHKSAGQNSAGQNSEASPVPPETVLAQPAAPVLSASTGLSVDSVASGALEREEEKFPELAPTEAALVESMPALLPLQSAASASTSSQETARETSTGISATSIAIQTSANGAASAAAPAKITLLLAAETQSPETKSLKTKNLETKNLETKSAEARSEESAPKVREVPAAVQKTEARDSKSTRREAFAQSSTAIAAENEVQTFGQIVADDSNQSPETGSKKNFLIALVLVLGSAGAVYYAWPQVSPLLMSVPIIQKYLGPQQAPNSTLAPAPVALAPAGTSTQAQATPGTGSAAQPAATSVAGQTPDSTASAAALSSSASSSSPSSAGTTSLGTRSMAPANSSDKTGAGEASSSSASASPAQIPLRVAPEVAAALLLEKPDPIYPPAALQQHIEGSVKLQAHIGKDGSTSNIKTLSGNPLLAASAVAAVKQWRYKPYALDGAPTEVQTQITVDFKLPQP
jgi:TonB family protein